MYSLEAKRLKGLRTGRWSAIAPNVWFLGITSLLTDISSEMVASILPIYLTVALRLTPIQVGFVDGLSQGTSALARLASGWIADRWRRDREVAAAGYALSAVCKLGLLAAGNAGGAVATAVALDRVGKGIRTTPRDALISLSSDPARLGLAFGVHRAFDTFGAMLGPLLAFAILAALHDAYDVIFVTSFCIAIVGLSVLLLFVRNVRAAPRTPGDAALDWPGITGLLRERRFRTLVLAGSALGLVTVADTFFYLALQRKASIDAGAFPLLYVGTAIGYLLLAVPAGRLGDRIGRGKVFLIGHAALLCACAALFASDAGTPIALLSLLLLGAYYACTDGVLMAAASAVLPAALRATGLALLTTATGLARFVASVSFGAAWGQWGIETAIIAFAIALALVLAFTIRTWAALEPST